jgi:hypothetical protein
MKPCWFRCLLLGFVVTVVPGFVVPGFAQTSASTNPKPLSPLEQTLIANDKAMADALKQKDVAFFKRIVTDDFVGVGTDGKLFDKNDVLENVRMADVQEYRPYGIEVLPMNDGAAVVTYDCIIRMTLYDDPIPRYQHISAIWVKQGEQWRLKFQQATAAE